MLHRKQQNIPALSGAARKPLSESETGATPGMDLIACAVALAPEYKRMLGEHIGLYLSDREKYIYCAAGEVKLARQAGDPVTAESIAFQTLRNAARNSRRVGREACGVAYIESASPVLDRVTGEVIGTIGIVTPITMQESVIAVSEKMAGQVDAIGMATANLSSTAEELAATTETLNHNAQNIQQEIKKTDEIISLIQEIADQTHMLGLNAAIEAARVGDAGRGFNVVAGEIRKLSQETKSSVKNILQALKGMQQSIVELTQSIGQMAAATQQQAASAEEISASINELETVAAELKEQADNLLNVNYVVRN